MPSAPRERVSPCPSWPHSTASRKTAQAVSQARYTSSGLRPSPLRTFVTGRYKVQTITCGKKSVPKNLKSLNDFALSFATRVKLCSRKRFNWSPDDGAKERSFPTTGSRAMPVTDAPELTPLAVHAVNSLSETYKQRGPDAFDEAALILFMAVGSIIARTRGPEVLQGAMEALRLAVETEGIEGPARRGRSTNDWGSATVTNRSRARGAVRRAGLVL